MTIQYNVSVKVLDPTKEWMLQHSLQGYRVFTDRSGNLEDTCFSKENISCVGEMTIVKTLKKEAAEIAYSVLSEVEGLLVLPINESSWEEDRKRVEDSRMSTGSKSYR